MRLLTFTLLILWITVACTPDHEEQILSTIDHLPEGQIFEINPVRDTVLFGEDGLRIFLPAHSLTNHQKDTITEKVSITLVEVITLADQLLAGAVGERKEGLVRIDARQQGEKLSVRPGVDILLQFPVADPSGEFNLYSGEIKRNGKVRRRTGKSAEKYLIPVDFSQLPFHPREFQEELTELLPFGEFREYSIDLADSLYFAFAGGDVLSLAPINRVVRMNEAYYHKHHIFQNEWYTIDSFDADAEPGEPEGYYYSWPVLDSRCGIDPIKIEALKAPEFAGSLLATTAFTERLRTILTIGEEAVLDIYLDNLEKNLWEADQTAADYLQSKNDARAQQFRAYAALGLTNTKGGEKYAQLLSGVLKTRMEDYEREIRQKREEIAVALENKSQQIEALRAEYRELLWTREKHRMEHLTFKIGDLGWYWPEREVVDPDTVFLAKLGVEILGAENYDELYLYNVMPEAESIYRLNTDDRKTFYPGSADEHRMYQILHQPAKIIAVGYRGENLFIGQIDYRVAKSNYLELGLSRSTRRRMRNSLGLTANYIRANDIRIDLPYARALQAETYRQSELLEQQYALCFLGAKAYPACNPEPTLAEAEVLFREYCASCHSVNLKTDLTGPALMNTSNRCTKMWFTRFTENSQWMILEGDPQALEQWREWGPTIMPSFAGTLTKAEISSIFKYIKSKE